MLLTLGHCDDENNSDGDVPICDVSGMVCEESGTYRPSMEGETKVPGQLHMSGTAGSDGIHKDDEEHDKKGG